jgi:hypothetical protein
MGGKSTKESATMSAMVEQTFQREGGVFVACDPPEQLNSAVFEDDGESAYFYAVDLTRSDNTILDAVDVCNAANVTDRDRPSTLSIIWSDDGLQCALLINRYRTWAAAFRASSPELNVEALNDWSGALIGPDQSKPIWS